MKIAIYNTYMNTMGGGEKHMGAIAEYVSKQPNTTVDILTEEPTDLEAVSKNLHVDLSHCRVIELKAEGKSVEEMSAEYDLFVNATHWSHIKPRAKKNAILIFFPILPELRFLAKNDLFRHLLDAIDQASTARLMSGVYSREKVGKRFRRVFGQWTKKEFVLSVETQAMGKHTVTIHTRDLQGNPLNEMVETILDERGDAVEYGIRGHHIRFRVPSKETSQQFTVRLKKTSQPNTEDARQLGVFVSRVECTPPSRFVARRLLLLLGRAISQLSYYNYLGYYDLVMSNSAYTESWLKQLWGVDSEIIYPIIDVDSFAPSNKKNIILSVGRFFEGGHNKKHLTMVRAFKEMYLDGKTGDWEYHLCGGTHEEDEHQQYLSRVQEEALGYPITIHPDIPFDDLKQLYGEASIFWHASGFGENEKAHPDRFEHFGITAVEAMSAGCIPVVIGKAGQKEIVTDGKNGYLWNTVPELKLKTQKVMSASAVQRSAVSQEAQERSRDFNTDTCHRRLQEVLDPLLGYSRDK